MGPPLAAGIAAIAAAIALLFARLLIGGRGDVFRDRLAWLVCAPMLLSGVVFMVVALILLRTVAVAGFVLFAWGAVHVGIAVVTLVRTSRSSGAGGAPDGSASTLSGPLGDHLLAAFGLVVVGTPVAIVGFLIWATSQRQP